MFSEYTENRTKNLHIFNIDNEKEATDNETINANILTPPSHFSITKKEKKLSLKSNDNIQEEKLGSSYERMITDPYIKQNSIDSRHSNINI